MTLHNLVTQQLQLTRNLIDTARSLHHSQTVAICPDYHYVTLEDTKQVCVCVCVCVHMRVCVCVYCDCKTFILQFIETHKPKVLKMKK